MRDKIEDRKSVNYAKFMQDMQAQEQIREQKQLVSGLGDNKDENIDLNFKKLSSSNDPDEFNFEKDDKVKDQELDKVVFQNESDRKTYGPVDSQANFNEQYGFYQNQEKVIDIHDSDNKSVANISRSSVHDSTEIVCRETVQSIDDGIYLNINGGIRN